MTLDEKFMLRCLELAQKGIGFVAPNPLVGSVVVYDGKIIGKTSSCAFGYRIGKPVALGMVRHHATSGIVVQVDIARQFFDATLVTHPLYDPEGIRMKS